MDKFILQFGQTEKIAMAPPTRINNWQQICLQSYKIQLCGLDKYNLGFGHTDNYDGATKEKQWAKNLFAIIQNTLCSLEKYTELFGQIHFSIWTNKENWNKNTEGCNGTTNKEKQQAANPFAIVQNTLCSLDKNILQFGQIQKIAIAPPTRINSRQQICFQSYEIQLYSLDKYNLRFGHLQKIAMAQPKRYNALWVFISLFRKWNICFSN